MATQIVRGVGTHSATSGGEVGSALLARVRSAWNDYMRYHRTKAELSALSDRELEDIGLHRVDIDAIARGGRA